MRVVDSSWQGVERRWSNALFSSVENQNQFLYMHNESWTLDLHPPIHTHIHTQNLTWVGSYTHLGGVLVRFAHRISFGQQQKGKNIVLFASPEAHRAD